MYSYIILKYIYSMLAAGAAVRVRLAGRGSSALRGGVKAGGCRVAVPSQDTIDAAAPGVHTAGAVRHHFCHR